MNALSQEVESDEGSDDDAHNRAETSSSHAARQIPRAKRSATLPGRVGSAAPAEPFDESSAGETSGDDSEREPPAFLSPMTQISKEPRDVDDDDDEDAADELLARSINAIHRPIAARRRTITGEAGEIVRDGQYVRQGPEMDEEAEEEAIETSEQTPPAERPMMLRQRAGTTASRRSLARRIKLSEKLSDIFGLEEHEKVVAGTLVHHFPSTLRGAHTEEQNINAGCCDLCCSRASCS